DSFGKKATAVQKVGTSFIELTISKGKGIGVGKVHERGSLDVAGMAYFEKIQTNPNQYASTGGGLDLRNSDIIGLNSLFFNDTMTGSAEAMQFPRDNTPAGSSASSDYDSFRVYEGTGFLNDKPIFTSDNETLWAGSAIYMQDGHVVTPSKKLSQCPNGWVLIWSIYQNGATAEQNFNFTYIPKAYPVYHSGRGMNCILLNHTVVVRKYLYITDSTITGYTTNSDPPNNTQVLRRVLSY